MEFTFWDGGDVTGHAPSTATPSAPADTATASASAHLPLRLRPTHAQSANGVLGLHDVFASHVDAGGDVMIRQTLSG
jgi:hypothetical protein